MFDFLHGLIEKMRKKWKIMLPAVVLVALIIGLVIFFVNRDGEEELEQDVLSRVEVKSVEELLQAGVIKKIGVIEPKASAPLIARTGGRVTAVNTVLGDQVKAGQTIVVIDGGTEANPARAQVASASASLSAFKDSRNQALRSAENAVKLAELTAEAVKAGKGLSEQVVLKARELADNAVLSAEFALKDAREIGNDTVVRTNDLALKAAELAQDQASLARDLASRQKSDGLKQAEQNLVGATITRDKIVADLESQRVALQGQVATARESWRLAQVATPLEGLVTSLNVRVGDFVAPGTKVGEVNGLAGAEVTLEVAEAVRGQLKVGEIVLLNLGDKQFSGEVVQLAQAPESTSALWQADIFVASTPEVVHAGDLVEVWLPVGSSLSDSILLPLDAVVVRGSGVIVFTVGDDNLVQENQVKILGYAGDLVEVELEELSKELMIVITGNRRLTVGDQVEIVR